MDCHRADGESPTSNNSKVDKWDCWKEEGQKETDNWNRHQQTGDCSIGGRCQYKDRNCSYGCPCKEQNGSNL